MKKGSKSQGVARKDRWHFTWFAGQGHCSVPYVCVAKSDTSSTSQAISARHGEWLGPRMRFTLWLATLILVTLFYLVIKAYSLNAYAGDEFIYLYSGKMIAQGLIPYADFAMAHPPLQMLHAALLFKLFGFSFLGARLLPALWCLIGGLALAWMVRREYGHVASIIAVWLFLTAYEPLRASSHFTGVNMTVALLIAAVAAYRSKAVRIAAIFCACAVFTRLYAVPGVLVLVVFAVFADRREGLRLVTWGTAAGAILFVATGLWTGFDAMIHNLVAYHTEKIPMSPTAIAGQERAVLVHNATIAALFGFSLIVLVATLIRSYGNVQVKVGQSCALVESVSARLDAAITESHAGLVILSSAIALFFVLVLTNLDRVWTYYYIPSFPFAGVAAAWMVVKLLRGGIVLVHTRGRIKTAGFALWQVVGGLAVALLFALSVPLSPRLERGLESLNGGADQPEEWGRRYAFPPSPLPGWMNNLVRRAFWQDDRIAGHAYHTLQLVLWHESRRLDVVDAVVETIERETSKQAEIFGDSGTVPLFALLTDRRIAANQVDTNIQRYRSGNVDPKVLVSRIDNPRTEMIILRANFGVWGVPDIRNLVNEKYRQKLGHNTV